jgi:adenine-specific DNA glycosylase
MDELLTLEGVGRKTANVILGGFYGLPGVVVDTHVRRLSQRLGLTGWDDPDRIEQDLMRLIPRKEWSAFSLRLIFFGREICTARNPGCPTCPLNRLCPSAKYRGAPPWMKRAGRVRVQVGRRRPQAGARRRQTGGRAASPASRSFLIIQQRTHAKGHFSTTLTLHICSTYHNNMIPLQPEPSQEQGSKRLPTPLLVVPLKPNQPDTYLDLVARVIGHKQLIRSRENGKTYTTRVSGETR